MFCPNCGTKNNYYHRFCFHCGARLISEPSGTDPEQPEMQESDPKDKELQPEETIRIPPDPKPQRREVDQIRHDSEPRQEEPETVPLPNGNENKDEPGKAAMITEFPESEPDEEEFDFGSRIPLRRYHKETDNGSSGSLQVLVKVCISVVLIALVGFLCYVGYDQLIKGRETTESGGKHIDLEYNVEETRADDGTTARKITVLTETGEQIKLLDQTIPVKDSRAEIILPDSGFGLQEYEQKDGALQISLDLLVQADDYPDREEKIEFEVPISTAPLVILSPSGKEAAVDGNSYQLILEVQPESEVFIDGNNYSHLVNEQGQLSVQLEVPDQPETRYEIRVSAKGYEDTIDEIILKKRQMEFPLAVNQSVPIRTSGEEWVEITGNTNPEAVLTTNLEMKETPVMDPVTGDFKLYVKASIKGYTPFVLTASLEGKENSVLELVIERPVEEREYTTGAWAADYDEMKNYPNLHNGISFAFTGVITEISSTGTKSTLSVDIAAEGQPEQIICVEYWGRFNFSMGQKIRIFGNHWGNKNGVPYILAPYLYR